MRGGHAARAALIQAYRSYLTNVGSTILPLGCSEAAAFVGLRCIQQASKGFIKHCLVQPNVERPSDGLILALPAHWIASQRGSMTAAAGLPPSATPLPWQHYGSPGSCQPTRSVHSSIALLADVEVKVPPMGESITEGTVASVLVKPGDPVKEDDVIAQIETDKVTVDVKYIAKESGVIRQILVNEQDAVIVGQTVCVVEQGAEAAPAAGAASDAVKETVSTPAPAPTQAPPKQPEAKAPASVASAAPAAAPSSTAPAQRPVRRVKMTRLRLRVAERLKGAQNTYAMLTTFNEVDMTALMHLRNEFKDVFLEKHGVKLGFMSAFVKATASALQLVPAVNGVIDGTDIVYRDYVDISIAVATPKGLVVPVVRNADQLSFADVERTMNSLAKKARDGSISIDEMAGGTFTISNGGVYGSMLSTPIINPPQSAILGMHNIQKRAWVVGDKIEPRPIMYIALTYDHRLIDGREAVTFLKRIKEVVEDPRRLLLDV